MRILARCVMLSNKNLALTTQRTEKGFKHDCPMHFVISFTDSESNSNPTAGWQNRYKLVVGWAAHVLVQ